MKRFKKTLLLGVILGIFTFAAGFGMRYYLPKAKAWIRAQVLIQSSRYSPFYVKAKRVRFNVFPLGVSLVDVEARPKAEFSPRVAPIIFKEITVT
ncbi:MAG: hypothetical protein KDD22_08730, partial [Bdellovibrionales bacterium]|nr:hypothetical protein [Bdellovibrionales bacterium]